MVDVSIESTMRDFLKELYETRDIEKALSLCMEDVDWVTPQGKFQGKEGIKRYLNWLMTVNSEMSCVDSGIGIVVKGNKAAYEHMVAGTSNGKKYQMPVMCAYEFSNGKIQHIRTVYDRLSLAQQVVKGGLPSRLVNTVSKNMNKGL